MSRLDELIAELCPDGVEYVPVGELFEFKNGLNKGKEFFGKGSPIVNFTDVFNNLWLTNDMLKGLVEVTDKEKELYSAKKNDVFFTRTSETQEEIGMASVLIEDIDDCVFSGFVLRARPKTDLLLPKFCSYYFSSDSMRKNIVKYSTFTTRALTSGSRLSKLMFPLPPLEVQREIVRILDAFTELTAELTAELDARKKQYEYYSKFLLSFEDGGAQWYSLKEIARLKAGKAISAQNISPEKTEASPIPCYGGNGLRGYVSMSNNFGNHSLIGRQGALCGNVCYVSDEFYATEHAVVVSHNDLVHPKYLYYSLVFADLNQYKTAGAQPGLSVEKLEKVKIPLPPLAEQERIVAILDRFDKLCNDISEGIPAEIEARRKQYEHYRDRLLTFKEKTA